MGNALLTFYIFDGKLIGTVDGHSVNLNARSGGGAGHKDPKVLVDPAAVDNPSRTRQKEIPGVRRGGPLPVGRYNIAMPAPHHGHSVWAFLDPIPYDPLFALHTGRDAGGFYIHARGHLGSDGCIVPMLEYPDYLKFMEALKKDRGGILTVIARRGGAPSENSGK